MNGRIYDPLLGRFLSADLIVQAPGNLQSYNRYSYVFNNPLSFTDPTGFTTAEEEKKAKEKRERQQAEEDYAGGTRHLSGSAIRADSESSQKVDKKAPTVNIAQVKEAIKRTARLMNLKLGTKVSVPVKKDGVVIGHVTGTVQEAASSVAYSAATSAQASALGGVHISSPTTRSRNESADVDVLTVVEGNIVPGKGAAFSVFREFAVDNPSDSGYIIQHIYRNFNGNENEYWEAWPVYWLTPNGIYYPASSDDTIEMSDFSSTRQRATESVTAEAYFLPGYMLNPKDGWSPGGFSESGSLMMTKKAPTGWPPSGNKVSAILSDKVRCDSGNDGPRTAVQTFSGIGATQVNKLALPTYQIR
jgi:hypothetical protein